MADLISRAAAIEYLMTNMGWHDEDGYEVDDADENRKVITDLVDGIPAVDAAPVVHARWIEYPLCLGYMGAYSEDHIVCSNCKTVWSIIDNDTERFNYCPNCGADMRGDNYGK